jgi:hypothetical protein
MNFKRKIQKENCGLIFTEPEEWSNSKGTKNITVTDNGKRICFDLICKIITLDPESRQLEVMTKNYIEYFENLEKEITEYIYSLENSLKFKSIIKSTDSTSNILKFKLPYRYNNYETKFYDKDGYLITVYDELLQQRKLAKITIYLKNVWTLNGYAGCNWVVQNIKLLV